MPEIGQLTRPKRLEVVIDLGEGDTVTLGFDQNSVTPAWVSDAEKRDSQNDTQSLPKALAEVITDWDVTNEGQPFPPSTENLAVLSYPVQAALLEQILTAAVPSRAEKNASSPHTSEQPSPLDSPLQSSPNGSETLPSPVASASQSTG